MLGLVKLAFGFLTLSVLVSLAGDYGLLEPIMDLGAGILRAASSVVLELSS